METKQNIDKILECICWAKNQGYVFANSALKALNLELETSFQFAEEVSSYGTVYTIEN